MRLTDKEKSMLDGDLGQGASLAMKILVGIGEAFEAERMIPIDRAHVALSNQDADTWFAEKLIRAGAVCQVPPTVNPGFDLDYFNSKGMVSPEDLDHMRRTHDVYFKLGARLNYSCTPYLFDNIPNFGEVVAFSESSATPYVNSVWGARTNRESAQSALCAAVAGRVPEYGLLLDRSRAARAVVVVEAEMDDDYDFTLLGWLTPRLIGPHIPVFTGLKHRPRPEAYMNLGAELNTAGNTPMYHVAGFTPEAPTLEAALAGLAPEVEVRITRSDLERQREALFEPGGPVDFVMLGCPHLSLRQVQEAANLIAGRKLETELWILTSSYTWEMARRMGLLETIEEAGGNIVVDTCVDQPCWRHLDGKVGATDSLKCAYYTKRRGMRFVVRSLRSCIQASLSGVIN